MKKLYLPLLVAFLVLFSASGFASAQSVTREQEQQRLRISPTVTGVQVRSEEQNQVRTQSEEAGLESAAGIQSKPIDQRSETAKVHMSTVAQKVEEILNSGELNGGIGEEVREVARLQNQAQEEIEKQIERLDSRPGWLKTVIGPDFRAIKNVRKEINQNQVRIRQFEELENRLANQSEASQVREMIEVLVQENTSLQEKLSSEESRPGFLGWFFRLFTK